MLDFLKDRNPTPDQAEYEAYFPSPYSLAQFVVDKTDFDGLKFEAPYTGGRWKVLMIAADERYMLMQNGKFFSTGNHPVETLLPMHHMDQAGFPIEVATVSGNPVKVEMWAMPKDDEVVKGMHQKYLPQFRQPKKLSDVLPAVTAPDSPYLAVFVPGGHGPLLGMPDSEDVRKVLLWALRSNRHIITLCHGPACLLAAAPTEGAGEYPFKGYKVCVFPDELDRKGPDIGYLPGPMRWLVAERLRALGVDVVNDDMTGKCYQDRKLLSGDSPLAANALGILAADALLKEVGV